MKILMDARSLGVKPSGIGIYIYNLIKEISKYPDFECSLITDVTLSNEMKEFEANGLRIYRYGKSVKKNFELFSYYKFVQWCINDCKPDVFWEGNNLVPIKIENPYGKMIATIHDMFPLSDPEHFGRVYPYYFRYGIRQTLKHFDILVYNSVNTKQETERFFPSAKDKQSFVGYIIVPYLEEREITDNGSFLYVGNLETRKGTDILLKAYRKYREMGGTKPLRLGGKVREEGIQKLLDETVRETQSVTYLGYLTEEDRNQEYASCSSFLFPSRAEGFGIPIIEVMNYNKPVIAGELDTLKEIVGDAITYFSLDNDPVGNLAAAMMDETVKADAKEYRKVIEKYSSEVLCEHYKKFLRENV